SAAGKKIYSCRVIPYRGSWLDLEFDHKDLLFARIDRRRKIHATVLLKALGYTPEDLLAYFSKFEAIRYDTKSKKYEKSVVPDLLVGQRCAKEVKDAKGTVLVKKDRKFTTAGVRKITEAGIEWLPIAVDDLIRTDAIKRVAPTDIVDESTGEVLIECNEELTQEHLDELVLRGINEFPLLYLDPLVSGTAMRDTLLADKTVSQEEAIIEIYRRLRPGDPPTIDTATNLFRNLFFNPERYDLSRVGRLKVNHKLGFDPDARAEFQPLGPGGPVEEIPLRDLPTLRSQDILSAVKYLVDLKNGSDTDKRIDDIDHLGNRRVRVVGELLQNQYRIGLVRMERAIKERMSLQEIETLMPHDLINSKPVSAVVKEFFGSSQLSQFMDQTNPLSAVTHKRRLSALGPGGLTRERAGFEVRDVHPTHYGRICPIETPEGPNIGLIGRLASYARVNSFGFIETPYRKVVTEMAPDDESLIGQILREDIVNPRSKKVTAEAGTMLTKTIVNRFAKLEQNIPIEPFVSDETTYLTADIEDRYLIAQANAPLDEDHKFVRPRVSCRHHGDFLFATPDQIDFMDVAPRKIVGVSASLIPFLEHDDANRALMGSNMQTQAVPLIKPEVPTVSTGMERQAAIDSGQVIVSEADGEVVSVTGSSIVVRSGSERRFYKLRKYNRSNQSTCIDQRPAVIKGQRVKAGDVIADSSSTENGELALGQNVLCAFISWEGGDFEDAILISESLVQDDRFTSVHIEKHEVEARDTKLGPEEITYDIPNVGEEALRDLNEDGIIRIGAEVGPNDILVGKITPKGEKELTPEEKLLRAIFGEKAREVKD
ncbi:MAG: DNA-directed RNA polymerase subunit beta, partial [candidate division NC10 bacterium]